VITYAYDGGGRLKQITGKLTSTSPVENYLNGIGYDEFGSRKNLVSGNGITTAYTYTPEQHRLSTVTASGKSISGATVQFLNVSYGYDLVGNVLTVNNNVANSAIQPNSAMVGIGPSQISNTYDSLNQLLSSGGMYRGHATSGQSYNTISWYDSIGNITLKSQVDNSLTFAAGASGLSNPTVGAANGPTSYTLNFNYKAGKAHQPGTISETNSTGTQNTRTETFDPDGNNTGDSMPGSNTRVLQWDDTDRLKTVTQNGGVLARYQYNPDGERTQKQDAALTTTFYFNQFLVINGSRQMTKSLFAGDTRIASKTESSALMGTAAVRTFYHPDNVGSTSYISNASQTLVQHERYFPTGERWSSPSEVVTTNNIQRNYLFTGKELDTDTNFYYFGARYFDPRTSNWLSTDPILSSYMKGDPNGGAFEPKNLALYTYGWNNPFVMRDPDGRAGVADPTLWFALPAGGAAFGEFLGSVCTNPYSCVGAVVFGAGFYMGYNHHSSTPPLTNVPPALGPASPPPSVPVNPDDLMSLPGTPLTPDLGSPLSGKPATSISGPTILQSESGFKVPIPRLSGKEGAKDVPSWAKGKRPFVNEPGKDFAGRLMNDQYGKGGWSGTGAGSEHSRVRKWGDRAFQNPPKPPGPPPTPTKR
jgi:RHS repeat-associated protein